MDQQYQGLGIRFRYPDDWTLSEELGDNEASVTVSSPETAFWSATVIRDRPDPDEILQTAVAAFQEEYDDLDFTSSQTRLANREVSAIDIDFICLELTNIAALRAFRTGQFTLLVLSQVTGQDIDEQEPLLEAISDSLICESDLGPLS